MQKVPFYKASGLELFKVFLMAAIGAILSIITIAIVYLLSGEWLPTNVFWSIFTLTAVVGFCCGLGWYNNKYTKLRLAGALIGFLTSLTVTIIFTDFSLIIRVPLALFAGTISAGIGYFLVWIDPQAYSE